jgi:hypothetical protein
MAITITWGTKVIFVPKADLSLIQPSPEIREMDIDWFRLQLKDLEDSEAGMTFPDTHAHNTEVVLGGVTYARIIEIINGYTVEFEDGQYTVNCVGANHNLAEVKVPNQVSLIINNAAGLIAPEDFDAPAIADAVWDEPSSGHTTPGTMGAEVLDHGALLLRILGLDQENFYIDQTQFISYEGADLMTQCRMRIYDSDSNVGTDSGVIATYQMVSTYLNGKMQTYKVTKP